MKSLGSRMGKPYPRSVLPLRFYHVTDLWTDKSRFYQMAIYGTNIVLQALISGSFDLPNDMVHMVNSFCYLYYTYTQVSIDIFYFDFRYSISGMHAGMFFYPTFWPTWFPMLAPLQYIYIQSKTQYLIVELTDFYL